MKSPGPSKAEQTIEAVLCLVGIAVAIALAIRYPSWLSIGFAVYVTVLLPIGLARSRRLGEEEMIRRQDKAMGKPTDDPRGMARWIP
jgi:hypothetical protein